MAKKRILSLQNLTLIIVAPFMFRPGSPSPPLLYAVINASLDQGKGLGSLSSQGDEGLEGGLSFFFLFLLLSIGLLNGLDSTSET